MNLRRNALSATAQTIVAAVVLFASYRILYQAVGAEGVGMWGLALAFCSIAKMAELGMPAATINVVAKASAVESSYQVIRHLRTASLVVASSVGLCAVVVFMGADWLAASLGLSPDVAREHSSIVAILLAATWVLSIAGVALAALDGLGRADLRNFVLMGGNATFFIGVLSQSPSLRLFSLAYMAQSACILALAYAAFYSQVASTAFNGKTSTAEPFLNALSFGAKNQVGTASMILFEPTSRFLVVYFGGIGSAGLFEMASRYVSQARMLIGVSIQVLVPYFARMTVSEPERLNAQFLKAHSFVLQVVPGYFLCVVFSAPLVSWLWLGRFDSHFCVLTAMLSFGWSMNTLASTGYYYLMGRGLQKWNLIAHVAIGIGNLCLGFLLGIAFGSAGVVVGASVALTIGASMVIAGVLSESTMRWFELLSRTTIVAAAWPIFFYLGFLAALESLQPDVIVLTFAFAAVFLGVWTGIRLARNMTLRAAKE